MNGWVERLQCGLSPRARHDPLDWRLGGAQRGVTAQMLAALPHAPRPAAVLLPLIDRRPEPTLLFTVRSPELRHHAGQISFPGGRMESEDADPMSAALREASEEIGLDSALVEPLGYLRDQLVLTGFRITPVVARVREPLQLRVDAREVSEVFEVPWSFLADESNYTVRERELHGLKLQSHELDFGPHRIWGSTAGMLVELRRIMAGGA